MRRLHSQILSMSPTTSSRPFIYRGDCASEVAAAAQALRADCTVAFPTETVYGLGANAWSTTAVQSIFRAKGRPSDNPLIVHISSLKALPSLDLTVQPLSSYAEALAKAFWPGPLTLVLPLSPTSKLSTAVTAGLKTVAIRVPSNPVAHALLAAAEIPIAAPSANTSGRPSPTSVEHVLNDLAERIDGVVDEGGVSKNIAVGLESTVVDCTTEEFPVILRPGVVTADDIFAETGVVVKDCVKDEKVVRGTPKAPGMKYRHYAPQAPLVLTNDENVKEALGKYLQLYDGQIGVMTSSETARCIRKMFPNRVSCVECGRKNDVKDTARNLYGSLRKFDNTPVEVILVTGVEEKGIGNAVMERLRKAAAGGTVK